MTEMNQNVLYSKSFIKSIIIKKTRNICKYYVNLHQKNSRKTVLSCLLIVSLGMNYENLKY